MKRPAFEASHREKRDCALYSAAHADAAFRASETYQSSHPKAGRFIAFDEPDRLRELYRVVREAQKDAGESG